MTRRTELPTAAEVTAAIRNLAESTGAPPPAIAVARALGLSNPTFWRHFPSAAQDLADARRASQRRTSQKLEVPAPEPEETPTEMESDTPVSRLQADLALAALQIQRLTLENDALRARLIDATAVIPFRVQTR